MSKRILSVEQQQEHEAFKQRLVEDVLGSETGDKVPMEKVVMLMWQFRDDPSVVTFMARFVAKYAGSRDVFDGIEFYLPQLAHMIIHLEVDWDDAILERFALVIAQQSVHFALQLNWILQGALQDYQPELNDSGEANSTYNPIFYTRCLKLLNNVERCVVYGKPRAQELQRLYEKGKITKAELILLEQADRRFNALQITTADHDARESVERLDGWLYIIPPPAKKGHKAKMVYRFCVLDRNVMTIYKAKGCCGPVLKLDRAMSLQLAEVSQIDEYTIRVQTEKYEFTVKCGTPEEQRLWLRRLGEGATPGDLFQSRSARGPALKLKSELTPEQLNRYEFFQNERDFVNDLTQIAEDLRFEERSERKKLAPGKMEKLHIPPNVYLPLCNSSDIWRRVSDKIPEETRVFNTKARCPVVMNFVSKRGERNDKNIRLDPKIDVAEYMHLHFDLNVLSEEPSVEVVASEQKGEEEKEKDGSGNEQDPNRLSDHGSQSGSGVWQEAQEDEHGASNTSPRHSATSRMRGNKKVQKLLRESVVTLPNKLAKQLKHAQSRKRVVSVMDRQTEMHPMVPILEGEHLRMDPDEASVVSVERSSVLFKDHILLGSLDEGDIELDSIDRATALVSGGQSWAQKSATMLEKARKQLAEGRGGGVQLEIASCLAKSNDDLRQEVFIMQMIHYYKSVFAQAKLPIWLKTYRILSTSSSTGLLELLTDATSIDGLKKAEGFPEEGGLRKYFENTYGTPDSISFKAAQTNFMQSLAGYSLVSYLLGLKDRHNGNIMIDTRGHLIFIDFGFALGMKVGHEFSFERAPFKLTKEYVEVMDGVGSECYKEFERLFVAGFEEARKNSQIALGLVEIMMYKSNYPCFSGWRYGKGRALTGFESRLMLRVPEKQVKNRAARLIRKSRQNFGTYLYDSFQKATNGYAI